MIWRLTWPETLAVFAVGLLIGWGSARVLRGKGLRLAWAVLCALAFVGCGLAGILFDIAPRLADLAARTAVQAGAVGAVVIGVTYTAQDS